MISEEKTTILYLVGKPGVGKYTIAKALAEKYSFIICDNQLINNTIFELLRHDKSAEIPDFAWGSISQIRDCVLKFLTAYKKNNFILTNYLLEHDGDKKLYEKVKNMAELRNSHFIPIKLLITQEEHLRRVVMQERRARLKSLDPQYAYDPVPLLSIVHPHLLELEVSHLTPGNAAETIAQHISSVVTRQRMTG
jgi:ribosome-binding ATPase YchF (GTP1/OBG family)